jgi:ABC-2 type transport system permease protein
VKLVWVHTRAATTELLRYPSFSVPTMLFPTVLFLAWGTHTGMPPNLALASYAAFAVLGVAFFQFGVGIAAERASPWHLFLRTLPVSAAVRFAARTASALVFALGSSALLVAVALATTSITLGPGAWAEFVAALLTGALPFSLLGIAIGYWLTPRGALPVANILFLGLAYLGGLLAGAGDVPTELDRLSAVLPTRLWGELLAASVGFGAWRLGAVLGLAAYGTAFALLGAWGYRRDEGERFR